MSLITKQTKFKTHEHPALVVNEINKVEEW